LVRATVEEVNTLPPLKEMEKYRPGKFTNTEFFSRCSPDMIEHFLVTYIKQHGELLKNGEDDLKFSKDTYKVKFTWTTPNQGSEEDKTKICVRILKVVDQERKYCVEFTKLGGKLMTFQDHLQVLKRELDWANDATFEPSKDEVKNDIAVEDVENKNVAAEETKEEEK
jgi:hypothetical protein